MTYYIIPSVIIVSILCSTVFYFLTRKPQPKEMRDELEPIKSALGFLK